MKNLICLFLVIALFPLNVFSQDGILDATFGTGGLVTTIINSTICQARAVAIQSDDKIVVVGHATIADQDFAVVRYNADGSLDLTFGVNGIRTIDFGSAEVAYAVAIQEDGKIVIAGEAFTSNYYDYDFAVARLTASGNLDLTFSGDGMVTTRVGVSDSYARGIVIQPDGKIVVIGYNWDSSNGFDFAIVRYTSTGGLDGAFGTSGITMTSFPGFQSDEAYGAVLQNDGKIVVVGNSGIYFALARYTASGALDATFGTSGLVRDTYGLGGSGTLYGVALNSTGKIVACGGGGAGDADFVLAQYTGSGVLDATFGASGVTITDFDGGDDNARALVIQSDGKIVLAGEVGIAGSWDFGLARFNSNGTLETAASSFGTAGETYTDFDGGSDNGYGVALQSDGKIVVAGEAYQSSIWYDAFGVARYSGSSGPFPVELTSFTAQAYGNKVELNWETATEVDNYGFEIERASTSPRQDNWENLGFVQGHGNSNSPKEYSFVDDEPLTGKIQYRLKQINTDGSFEIFKTIEVNIETPSEFELSQNYPNPFNPTTTINFTLPTSGNVKLNVYNSLGEKVAELINKEMEAGYHKINFNAFGLTSGVYFYSLETQNYSEVKKMIVLR